MFKQTVNRRLLLLIDKLSSYPEIYNSFYLAGGTALSLQLGHRKSVDIDLFTEELFNPKTISEIILKENGIVTYEDKNSVHANINGAGVSFLHYPYKMMQPLSDERAIGKIRLASID